MSARIDFISDTIENARQIVVESFYDLENNFQSERDAYDDEIGELKERVERAEGTVRELLDKIDDMHRGLCDRDELITGRMLRELMEIDRFEPRTIRQVTRDWEPEK